MAGANMEGIKTCLARQQWSALKHASSTLKTAETDRLKSWTKMQRVNSRDYAMHLLKQNVQGGMRQQRKTL